MRPCRLNPCSCRYATVDPPDVLATALGEDPAAANAWDALSYSKKKAHAHSITSARAEDTRQRRLAEVLQALRA